MLFIIISNSVNAVVSTDLVNIAAKSSTNKPVPKIKFSKIKETEKKAIITEFKNKPDVKSAQVSKTDLIKISKIFVNGLINKDRAQVDKSLNKEVIIEKSLAGSIQKLGDLSLQRDKILRGIANIPDILMNKIGSHGQLKYLRLVKRDNGYRGLVRFKYNRGEISYLELLAQKDKNGDIRIVDFYDLMLGRSYTRIVSQMLIAPEQKTVNNDKIIVLTQQRISFQQRYAKTIRHYNNDEFKEALNSFQRLPTKFKATRDMLLLRIQIAKATNRNAYRESLQLLENQFSSEPDLALLLADHYFFTKQYPQAFKAINTFSDYIGGDIALDNLRLKLYISQNKFKKAIAIGTKAIREDDSYEDIYWLMLKAYLHSYQYENVGKILDVLLDNFNAKFEIETFYKDSFYREYGFSKQFKRWKEKRTSNSDKI